jgi:hypothetical protein
VLLCVVHYKQAGEVPCWLDFQSSLSSPGSFAHLMSAERLLSGSGMAGCVPWSQAMSASVAASLLVQLCNTQ